MAKEDIRVLLVEDDEEDYLFARHLLSDVRLHRYEVTWADRLKVALNYLADSTVDVILLDLTLPDSYGWETFTAMRERVPDVPIVLLTGFQDEDLGTRAVHAGAQDYLEKGELSSELLSRSINYAIERLRAQEALQSAYKELESLIAERTQELARTTQQLQIEIGRRERLEHALREGRHIESICAFVDSATHRFGSLLASIRDRVGELSPSPNGTGHHESVEEIMEAASCAADISSSLAGLTKAVGASEGKPESMSVSRAVRNIVEQLSPALAKKGVKVVTSEAGFIGHVHADSAQLIEILTLLIANAPLVLPEGGNLRLRLVECAELPEKLAGPDSVNSPQFVVCEVFYSGVQMVEAAVDTILNPIAGLATTLEDGVPPGLGLAVVQSRSRGWGGRIEVCPAEEHGGGFRVYLPVSSVDSTDVGVAASSLVGGSPVLIVDDDVETVDLVTTALADAGYGVVSAGDGPAAVTMLQADGVAPAAAVMDATLPGEQSRGLLASLTEQSRDVPVLVVSGFSRDYLHGLLPRGDWHFLQKPFSDEDVRAAVDQLVRTHLTAG